jgi:UDP-4-amino-4,6-dideoxy-N-acetyl-beta-L-altrosamine N-acetyltransferase
MPLRKLNKDDLQLILSWRNTPEVRKNMYSTKVITETEHYTWFERIKSDPQSLWYIHTDENDNADGVVYFTQYRPENRSTFWGFYTSPSAQAGTGTKLGIDALNEAFYVLDLHKINADVLINNKRSIHFHEKLGFIREGTFRDYHFNGEQFVDVVRLGVLKSEWVEKRL